jgi:hypothetical protein
MTAPFPGQIARFLHKRYYANDVVLKGRPAALSFGANPRHAHEWKAWKDVRPQEGKVIIPGVIDSTSNFVEDPELVVGRIVRYANVVGRERMLAGVECGWHLRRENRGGSQDRVAQAPGADRRGQACLPRAVVTACERHSIPKGGTASIRCEKAQPTLTCFDNHANVYSGSWVQAHNASDGTHGWRSITHGGPVTWMNTGYWRCGGEVAPTHMAAGLDGRHHRSREPRRTIRRAGRPYPDIPLRHKEAEPCR